MPEDKIVEPKLLKGFRDYLPTQMNARLKIIAAIRGVYERYGFQPLETPALEYRSTLMGYGEENTKQIFEFQNPEEEHVALRFDLTGARLGLGRDQIAVQRIDDLLRFGEELRAGP